MNVSKTRNIKRILLVCVLQDRILLVHVLQILILQVSVLLVPVLQVPFFLSWLFLQVHILLVHANAVCDLQYVWAAVTTKITRASNGSDNT